MEEDVPGLLLLPQASVDLLQPLIQEETQASEHFLLGDLQCLCVPLSSVAREQVKEYLGCKGGKCGGKRVKGYKDCMGELFSMELK